MGLRTQTVHTRDGQGSTVRYETQANDPAVQSEVRPANSQQPACRAGALYISSSSPGIVPHLSVPLVLHDSSTASGVKIGDSKNSWTGKKIRSGNFARTSRPTAAHEVTHSIQRMGRLSSVFASPPLHSVISAAYPLARLCSLPHCIRLIHKTRLARLCASAFGNLGDLDRGLAAVRGVLCCAEGQ